MSAPMGSPPPASAVLARYRQTLHTWAAQHVPEGARVTSVEINYDDGWDPTFTPGDPSVHVYINYVSPRRGDAHYCGGGTAEVLAGIGELLTALFAIEENDR